MMMQIKKYMLQEGVTMIDSMYDVMLRIAELQERFGLKRHNVQTETPTSSFEHGLNEILNIERTNNGELKNPSEYTREDINRIADYFARQNNIPEDLIRSMISVESSYNPLAVSPKGAMGLMQIMPVVAGEMNVDDPFSPMQNIEAGTGYLRRLLDRYNEDYTLSLAAYNAGMGNVDRVGGVPNFKETKRYIDKVVSTYLENSQK